MTEKDVYKNGVALLEEWEDVNYCEHSFKFKDEWLTDKEVVDLLNALYNEKGQLQKELDYIQNSITEHIKHQKTELGQKALKEIIVDYNEWMLGHKELGE